MEFDRTFFNEVLDFANDWWNRFVICDIPPPLDSAHPEDAKSKWPTARIGSHLSVDKGMAEIVLRIKQLQEEEKSLKDTLRFSFEDCEQIEYDGMSLATYKNQFSKRFDTDAFKKANPELYEKYLKQTESRVLRIL